MALPPRVSDLVPFDLLLSVARLGSLGRAAQAHGISQPAASTRLRRLERQPATTVTLTAGNSAQVAQAVLAGAADVGFVGS